MLQAFQTKREESYCYGLTGVHPGLYVKALTPSITILEDRAFQEVIKIKCGPMSGALI